MDEYRSRLWQGGPWERPQSVPAVLPQTPGRAVRGRKSSRTAGESPRRGHELASFLAFVLMITITTAAAVFLSKLGIPDSLLSLFPALPGSDTDPGYSYFYDSRTSAQPTTIPRAAAGGSLRITLSQRQGQVLSLQEIYKKNLPSIVFIQALSRDGASSGTGVVLSADGYIVTNEHVISGATSAQVILQDNTRLEARLVGYHTVNDLAVLKVEATDLVPAEFGDSAQLEVGDTVVAIGNPLGSELRGTLTDGIVSAINRPVNVDGTSMTLIQTTAALNPGNSGGALINDRGQVVGITVLKMMSKEETIENLGFAIPSRLTKSIVDQIIATGVARVPVLGIRVLAAVEKYGGLYVQSVDERSDAWTQGMRPGDIIVKANGVPITSNDTLTEIKEFMLVGDTLTLVVERSGARLEMEVKLIDADILD